MQLRNDYMYYTNAIPLVKCKEIISYGLSKMTIDESKGHNTNATTFDGKEKGGVQSNGIKTSSNLAIGAKTKNSLAKTGVDLDKAYVRDSKISWLNDKWLYDLFHPYIHHANKNAGCNWEWDFSEPFQFTVYHGNKQNGGFYGWHSDGQSDSIGAYKAAINMGSKEKPDWRHVARDEKGFIRFTEDKKPIASKEKVPLRRNGDLAPGYTDNIHMWDKVRKLSMTVNLTEPQNYAGGNLKFDFGPHRGAKRFHTCKEIRPTGSIIIFPSYTYHCVTPVTRGTRYSLVLWSLGKPFR